MIPETLGAAFPQASQGFAGLSKAKILQVAFSGLTCCIGKKNRGFSKISNSVTGHACPVVGSEGGFNDQCWYCALFF